MRYKKILFVVITLASFCCLTHPGDAYADSIDDKWMYTQYYQCMLSDNVESEIPEIPLSGNVIEWVFWPTGDMYLPSYNKMGKEKMNCREVAKKVLSRYSSVTWRNNAKSEELMTSVLKYEPFKTGSNGESIFNITAKQHVRRETKTLWFTPTIDESDSDISTVQVRVTPNADGTMHYQLDSLLGNAASTIKLSFKDHNMIVSFTPSLIAGCTGTAGEMSFPLKNDVREFYNDVVSGLENVTWSETCDSSNETVQKRATYSYTFTTDGDSQIVDYSNSTGYRRTIDSAANSVAAISSYGGVSGIKFTNNEFFTLYNFYLDKAISAGGAAANKKTCNPSSTNNLTKVKLLDAATGKLKECYVNLGTVSTSTNVYTQVGGPAIGQITLLQMIEWLNGLTDSDLDLDELDPGIDSDNDNSGYNPGSNGSNNSQSSGGDDVDECFGTAGSLGWILCPVLRAVSEGVDDIYKGYIQEQFLEVNYENFNEGSPVHTGWKVVRNMANIIFVILFLIVLFSQLTGIGISNYNIKKMLPRLIIVAVLVNISFLICQFAVDVSNVLGYSLNSIFSQMSNSTGLTQATATNFNSAAGSNIAGWVGVLAIAIGAGTIGSWLIPLLLTLLSCAISVFFGAIILGARQAGILILAVLAPAAIVCYALPNSKTFFDRWLKMFVGLLMVFPICGALMGGGYFASNIILATPGANFFVILVGMLLRVVPFFLIPSLIRSAFMAMGNIGAKIANVGNKVGRTTTGAVARSDFIKRRDADLARMQGGATALRGRALSKITGKPMSDRRKAKIARQYAKYNKLKSEEAAANPYAMSPGSREYEALKNAAHQNRIDTLAKNIALENTNIATDENALAEKHAEALASLNEDQSDENLATVQAYQDMLITSDGGRTKMFDNYAQATMAGRDKGIELGAQHLLRNHTKDIKPNNRDFFSYLGEASRISNGGDIQRDSFRQYADDKGNTHYLSSHFTNQGIGSYDAASIAKMDEGSLDRLIEQAGSGGLQEDQKRILEQYTRQAMTSDTIHVQDKIATKFNTLRSKMGYQAIDIDARNTNTTDSGTIQVQGNTGGSGSDNTILRTGNDDRTNRTSESLPTPLRDGENYRQNDSGIWLPPSSNT